VVVVAAQSLDLSSRHFSVITIINGQLEGVGKTNIEHLSDELSIDKWACGTYPKYLIATKLS
jgi:hypothetical protein